MTPEPWITNPEQFMKPDPHHGVCRCYSCVNRHKAGMASNDWCDANHKGCQCRSCRARDDYPGDDPPKGLGTGGGSVVPQTFVLKHQYDRACGCLECGLIYSEFRIENPNGNTSTVNIRAWQARAPVPYTDHDAFCPCKKCIATSVPCYRCRNVIHVPKDATLETNLCVQCGGIPPLSADGGFILSKAATKELTDMYPAGRDRNVAAFQRKLTNEGLRDVFG